MSFLIISRSKPMHKRIFSREHGVSAGSNDHFVVVVVVVVLLLLPSLVHFDGRPPGGANFQY
jgi:hypothetical protein